MNELQTRLAPAMMRNLGNTRTFYERPIGTAPATIIIDITTVSLVSAARPEPTRLPDTHTLCRAQLTDKPPL